LAVTIRLTRMGRKKRPYYRIVVTDTRAPRDGRYIECLGTYDSMEKPASVKIEETRTHYWLDKGAVPSDTVKSLLKHRGILLKRNLKKRGFDEAKIEEELNKWDSARVERLKKSSEKTRISKKAKDKAAKAKAESEKPKETPAPAAPQAEAPSAEGAAPQA
jgi:small subunit ribosomal protein S16